MQNPREALDYLKEARDVSKTKMWNTLKTLGGKPSSIFKECNVLLYKALLILARQERPKDPDYALKACTEATKSAADGMLVFKRFDTCTRSKIKIKLGTIEIEKINK